VAYSFLNPWPIENVASAFVQVAGFTAVAFGVVWAMRDILSLKQKNKDLP
jgi:hypothetical protein